MSLCIRSEVCCDIRVFLPLYGHPSEHDGLWIGVNGPFWLVKGGVGLREGKEEVARSN